VTSGAKGDGKLLLWNALRGELVADLNSNLRYTLELIKNIFLCRLHVNIEFTVLV
jgi:hypothetical protein